MSEMRAAIGCAKRIGELLMSESHATPEVHDERVDALESTGFSAENINRTLVTMDPPSDYVPERRSGDLWDAEIAAFDVARQHINAAEYRVGVLSAGLYQHIHTLKARIRIREPDTQAWLSLAEIDDLLINVLSAREALFVIVEGNPERAGVGTAKQVCEIVQAGVGKAKRVCEIVDRMEAAGEFRGLTDDQKETAREIMITQLLEAII